MSLPRHVVNLLLGALPDSRLSRLKARLLRLAGVEVGPGAHVCSGVKIMTSGEVSIGANSWVGHACLLTGGRARISIGSNVDIGPRVTIVTGSHEISRESDRAAGTGISRDLSIGDGTWIGASSTILGGAHLGPRCIVAAGSVVKGTWPDESVLGGVPARPLRLRAAEPGSDSSTSQNLD
jgi:acetyltransferase-like isoleucine patch superfamily enzyme